MSNSNSIHLVPSHIRQARAALQADGALDTASNRALDLATTFYNETPQISRTDDLRRERNLLQDELETVSSQLQRERQQSHRLQLELTAALGRPEQHQSKAYQLRKRLRAILAVLEHPQAKETTKLKSIAKLVALALAGSEQDPE